MIGLSLNRDDGITIQQLEALLDEKIKADVAWGKARVYATEVNGVENRAERVLRDIMEHEAYRLKHAAEEAYNKAIEAYVKQKKGE